jgi:hypothetical protein
MLNFKDAARERELKRWMRPDAHNFVRPDWRRYVAPGSEAAAVFKVYEQKYRPDQLRDDHGRWADEGGGAEGGSPSLDATPRPRSQTKPTDENRRLPTQVADYCDAMHRKDLFICRAVRLRACYEQAYLRLSNCQVGRPIPNLNF